MSVETIVVILLVGLVAGWLAGQIVKGAGFGLVGDILVGIVGALIGSWLLPQLGVNLSVGLFAVVASATIGAVAFLLVIKLVRQV